MDFINGTKLHAALPVFRAGRIDHYVVLVERPGTHPVWITATMVTLDDTYWSYGDYYVDRDNAINGLYVRAGIADLVTLPGVADTMRARSLDRV